MGMSVRKAPRLAGLQSPAIHVRAGRHETKDPSSERMALRGRAGR